MTIQQSFVINGLAEALSKIEVKGSFLIGEVGNNVSYDKFENDLPDPNTLPYRTMVLDLYRQISGQDYNPYITEMADVDLINMDQNSFPWSTRDPGIAAMYLFMIAATLECFKGTPAKSSVLEFGPGWGETTLALARLDFNITCIEINPSFVSLIQSKAAALKLTNVQCLLGDFSLANTLESKFETILFFECFHHAFRHDLLLDRCIEMLTETGVIIFSGEPVTDSFPVPWGLRLDAQSLFCVAKYGWMELGFSSGYFRHLLQSRGLVVIENVLHQFKFFKTYKASRCLRVNFVTAPLGSQIGVRDGAAIRSNGDSGILVYGPYWSLEKGDYTLSCDHSISERTATGVAASLRITAGKGEIIIASRDLTGINVEIDFSLKEKIDDIEFTIQVLTSDEIEFREFLLRIKK